jgi:hypothetical protein
MNEGIILWKELPAHLQPAKRIVSKEHQPHLCCSPGRVLDGSDSQENMVIATNTNMVRPRED